MALTLSGSALGLGKVLQVVEGSTSTAVTNSSTSTWVDTGLTASITPSSSTSKILCLISQNVGTYGQSAGYVIGAIQLLRGSTMIRSYPSIAGYNGAIGTGYGETYSQAFMTCLDSPASTATLTYKTQQKLTQVNTTSPIIITQNTSTTSSMLLVEVAP